MIPIDIKFIFTTTTLPLPSRRIGRVATVRGCDFPLEGPVRVVRLLGNKFSAEVDGDCCSLPQGAACCLPAVNSFRSVAASVTASRKGKKSETLSHFEPPLAWLCMEGEGGN